MICALERVSGGLFARAYRLLLKRADDVVVVAQQYAELGVWPGVPHQQRELAGELLYQPGGIGQRQVRQPFAQLPRCGDGVRVACHGRLRNVQGKRSGELAGSGRHDPD